MDIILVIIFGIGIAIFIGGIKIVDQYHRAIVLRFGKLNRVLRPGFNWIIPGVDIIKRRVDIRERVIDMKPQSTLTRDKVTLAIDAIIRWRIQGANDKETIESCIKNELSVKDVKIVMQQTAEAQLREIISSKDFSEVLEKKDIIAKEIQKELEVATDRWGVDVTSVQIRDIQLPEGMKRAMAQRAEAEIEKQARLTKAQAEKEAFKIMEELGEIARKNPAIIELRRLQTLSEIGAEKNTTIVMPIPMELFGHSIKINEEPKRGKQDGK